jgi:quinoprotein glucose dehydrogenase
VNLLAIVAAVSLATTAAVSAGAWPQAAQPAEGSASSVWRGVFTEEQATRGEGVYRESCANCHGPELEGADMTPPLIGGSFTSNWNQLTVGDLFERIRTTMPLDRPGKLSRQQISDVIAFTLKANGWPAGSIELSRDLAALKQIKIEPTKPPSQQ